MAPRITHSKVSGRAAGNDPNRVYGTDWDADHTITGLTIGTDVQAHAAVLDGLSTLAGPTGLVAETATNTFTNVTITGTSNRVAVTNGTGAAGNPTVDIDAAYVGQSSITTLGTVGTGTWNATTIALNKGGTGQTTQQAAFDALAPTATRAGDIPVWNGTHYVTIPGNNAGTKVLQQDSSGNSSWAAPGAGTVVSVVANGVTITNTGAVPPPFGLVNHSLAVSAAAGALTIALKDNAGSDPSATSPVNGYFRNATSATGSLTQLTVTAALSLTIASGATMNVTSSTAFRMWVVLFNDAGTARLGVINCLSSTDIFPLFQGNVASSTALSGSSNSSGVFYTGSAVTAKAYLVVGYIEWSTSGVTAGTWTTTNVVGVESYGFGIPLPGTIVQFARTSSGTSSNGSTTVPFDNTIPQNTEGDQYLSKALTPSSAANILRIRSQLIAASSVADYITASLFQDSTANALATTTMWQNSANSETLIGLNWAMQPGTTSSTTIKLRAGSRGGGGGTMTTNGHNSTQEYGGALNSYLEIEEVMA